MDNACVPNQSKKLGFPPGGSCIDSWPIFTIIRETVP